jgi:YidC/Oxa1 family membrane protein insertase
MERKDLDLKGLLIIFAVITLFLFGYQAYLIFFAPQQTTQQPPKKPEEKPKDVPSLLLGTTREKEKPQSLRTFNFEKFSLTLSEEGARIVSLVDKKYKKELITEEEKRLNLYPLEVYTGDPQIDYILNFSRYEIYTKDNQIIARLKN